MNDMPRRNKVDFGVRSIIHENPRRVSPRLYPELDHWVDVPVPGIGWAFCCCMHETVRCHCCCTGLSIDSSSSEDISCRRPLRVSMIDAVATSMSQASLCTCLEPDLQTSMDILDGCVSTPTDSIPICIVRQMNSPTNRKEELLMAPCRE